MLEKNEKTRLEDSSDLSDESRLLPLLRTQCFATRAQPRSLSKGARRVDSQAAHIASGPWEKSDHEAMKP